ncbi:hypothetical protein MIR68_005239 [Amoeboaphelidium protococcarum]|nr:hypothetical protein MIR68_005239 [Amoeboaphelidium protococcarum]
MSHQQPLKMYIIVRRDLSKMLKWPGGAVIAQACHASTLALHQFKDDSNTSEYLKDAQNMHKVVLQIEDEAQLKQLSNSLSRRGIDHVMWMEQPENIATCISTKPYRKNEIGDILTHLKLYK